MVAAHLISSLTSKLVWVKLSNDLWWPANLTSKNSNEDSCFISSNPNLLVAKLFGADNDFIPVDVSDSNSLVEDSGNDNYIGQEVPPSLSLKYNLAVQQISAARALSNNSTIETCNSIKSLNSTMISPLGKRDYCSLNNNQSKLEDDSNIYNNDLLSPSNDNLECAPQKVRKRIDVLPWDDYFMSVSFLSAMRSKDPSTQVGACIVNEDKRIVGIGYNGFPRGCSDDILPWAREGESELDTKYPYVCHAEVNAILNKNSADVRGCSMYVALFPCNDCAKVIIQSGIKEVIFLSDKYHNLPSMIASRRMLNLAKVNYRQHHPTRDSISIKFEC